MVSNKNSSHASAEGNSSQKDSEHIDREVFELSTKAKRLLKYFPDLRNEDQYLTEFNVNCQTALEFNKPLNPSYIRYSKPDFGFNDYLNIYD